MLTLLLFSQAVDLANYLTNYTCACPDTKIVLAGYSSVSRPLGRFTLPFARRTASLTNYTSRAQSSPWTSCAAAPSPGLTPPHSRTTLKVSYTHVRDYHEELTAPSHCDCRLWRRDTNRRPVLRSRLLHWQWYSCSRQSSRLQRMGSFHPVLLQCC